MLVFLLLCPKLKHLVCFLEMQQKLLVLYLVQLECRNSHLLRLPVHLVMSMPLFILLLELCSVY